jgi:hypothetical protein
MIYVNILIKYFINLCTKIEFKFKNVYNYSFILIIKDRLDKYSSILEYLPIFSKKILNYYYL